MVLIGMVLEVGGLHLASLEAPGMVLDVGKFFHRFFCGVPSCGPMGILDVGAPPGKLGLLQLSSNDRHTHTPVKPQC